MYYDEDFYREPSEFEAEIFNLKVLLMKSVKEEHIEELERLRKENAELQDVKKKMKQIELEHRDKIRDLDIAKSDALNIVRREKLSKLTESLYVKVYKPSSYREQLPKCDNCNNQRAIEFSSPTGRKMTEDCACKTGQLKYRVEENVCVEFASRDGRFQAWYKPSNHKDSDHMVSSNYMEKLHDDIPFKEIKSTYNAYFLDESKCQIYCDWLTQKENE